mmetsp:Transcript_45897/g.82050  ORF Transcript_45897/g.82050 Transcript_45897/m.82050 type:complete len:329 (+) Transcript_45897:1250-2236(+)
MDRPVGLVHIALPTEIVIAVCAGVHFMRPIGHPPRVSVGAAAVAPHGAEKQDDARYPMWGLESLLRRFPDMVGEEDEEEHPNVKAVVHHRRGQAPCAARGLPCTVIVVIILACPFASVCGGRRGVWPPPGPRPEGVGLDGFVERHWDPHRWWAEKLVQIRHNPAVEGVAGEDPVHPHLRLRNPILHHRDLFHPIQVGAQWGAKELFCSHVGNGQQDMQDHEDHHVGHEDAQDKPHQIQRQDLDIAPVAGRGHVGHQSELEHHIWAVRGRDAWPQRNDAVDNVPPVAHGPTLQQKPSDKEPVVAPPNAHPGPVAVVVVGVDAVAAVPAV